jgi:hypothetical protein
VLGIRLSLTECRNAKKAPQCQRKQLSESEGHGVLLLRDFIQGWITPQPVTAAD